MVSVFLPIRSSSKRILNKNFLFIDEIQSNLLQFKVNQLLEIAIVKEIIISTDVPEKIGTHLIKFDSARIKIIKREDRLCSDNTKTIDLVSHMLECVSSELILWTHCTSPLFNTESYLRLLHTYEKVKRNYNSITTVKLLRDFALFRNQPINFGGTNYWPNTQDLEPLMIINNAAFLIEKEEASKNLNRIGSKPFFMECTGNENLDIDWPEDLELFKKLV